MHADTIIAILHKPCSTTTVVAKGATQAGHSVALLGRACTGSNTLATVCHHKRPMISIQHRQQMLVPLASRYLALEEIVLRQEA